MSFNLVDTAKSLITNELINKASSFLGESESGVTKAIGGILPSLLGGIVDKVGTHEGANTVTNLALQANSTGFLSNLNGFFGNEGGGSMLNKGASLVTALLGENKLNTLTGLISNFSGIKSSSAGSLLSMASTMVLGLLGKHATTNNLNGSGMASFLGSQKSSILSAIPSGLNLNSVFKGLSAEVGNGINNAANQAKYVAHETTQKASSGIKWLLPLLVLALLGAAAWYFLGKGCNSGTAVADNTDSLKSTTEKVSGDIKNTLGQLDSVTGDWMYNAGANTVIELPNNVGQLLVGENSTENKLYKFLMDSNKKLDTVKGNWFEFTNVHFKTGGTQLDSASMVQLKNMVAITKAFPTAEFKLGGYTDNTGDSSANVILSQKRAEVVVEQLKKLGASPKAFTGAKGYGPQWPLADNTTPVGRAQNRRVAVNVKAR